MSAPAAFNRYRSAVTAEMRQVLAQWDSPLNHMMAYHLGWLEQDGTESSAPAGKALRPALCLLSCESLGGVVDRAVPAAAAVELVHNFSLIHDDIQDDDLTRRHRPTVWSIWGKPQAINAGTAMRILAGLALSRLADRGVPDGMQLLLRHNLDEASLRLINGQFLDISFEERLDVGVDEYIFMIRRKTAVLIACAIEFGALLAGADDATRMHFCDFGMDLGLAFQVRDDVLGIWGDESRTGKPLGSDIRHRKKTLPLVYALEHAGGCSKDDLVQLYRSHTVDEDGVKAVMAVLDAVAARQEAQRLAEDYCERALQHLAGATVSPSGRAELEEVARFLVSRDF
ncbi:MAG: polyprenyl synthetase family protein [Chloroflexota bacterium]